MTDTSPPTITKPPLTEFQVDGTASRLLYNLPSSSTYHGHGLMDLSIPSSWFTDAAFEKPPDPYEPPPGIVLDPPPWADSLPLAQHLREQADLFRASGNTQAADIWQQLHDTTVDLVKQLGEGLSAKEILDKILGLMEDLDVLVEGQKLIQNLMTTAENLVAENLPSTSLWMPGYADLFSTQQQMGGFPTRRALSGTTAEEPATTFHALKGPGLLAPADVVRLAKHNLRIIPVRTQSGRVLAKVVAEPSAAHPRLLVVEYYRLSSFPANYGAGRTLNTFTLLPGEESTITIRTWKQMTETLTESSSILDSYESEVADEFQDQIQSEHSNKQQRTDAESWNVEASASASWFFGSASMKADAHGSFTSARENNARNMQNALSKHSAKASNQRKVEINSATERRVEEGEEVLVTRTLKNINLSRVLNFVFRELNQEYVSYLHLLDVRIAFVNDFPPMTRLYSLADFDDALETFILDEYRQQVKDAVFEAYSHVRDHWDAEIGFIEVVEEGESTRGRVVRGPLSEDPDLEPGQGFDAQTPGVIVSRTRSVLPTDAIIVDALLGEGVALDQYALASQEQALAAQRASNRLAQGEADKLGLGLKIVKDEDASRAELYRLLFPPPEGEVEEDLKPTDD